MTENNKTNESDDIMISVANMDLRNKVTISSTGVDLDKIEKAESVIASLADSYLDWAMEDVSKLDKAYVALTKNLENYEENLKAVFEITHDMKGQGGSFNYDLITDIGNYLCRFIERIKGQPTPKLLDVIKLHIDAMRIILVGKIKGDGGIKGEKILEGLEATLQKYTPDLVEEFHYHKDKEKELELLKRQEFENQHSVMSTERK